MTAYITVIAILSVILAIFCVVCGILKWTGKLNFRKKSSLTEMTLEVVANCSQIVTDHYDDVIPNLATQDQLPGNGHYKSLRRDENADRDVTDVTQTRKPDYLNISPSNRNDSSANCMYTSPNFLHKGADKTKRPYVNVDSTGSGDI